MGRQLGKETTQSLTIRLSLAVLIFAIACIGRLFVLPLSVGAPFAIFYPAVVITFLLCGIGPGILGTVLSLIAGYDLFIPPNAILAWKPDGLPATLFFVASAAVTGFCAKRMIERRQKLEELTANQKAILNTDLVGILKFQGEKIVWANAGIEQMLGWGPGALTGQSIRILHPDDASYAEARNSGAAGKARGVALRREMQLMRRDGQVIWADTHGTWINTVTDESLWVCADISDRKSVEEALRRSRAFLARTGAAAGVGGWEYDLRTKAVIQSDETCRMLDLPLADGPALSDALRFYPPEARPLIQRAVRQAITRGTPWDLELPMLSATGRPFWGRAVGEAEFQNGVAVRLIGALQDVTVRRQRDQEQAREMHRVTLESIGDAIITTDMQGAVLWLNASAERLTGWSQHQVLGRPLHSVFTLIDGASRQPVDPAQPSAQAVLVSRRGTEYGIELTLAPIRDMAGNKLGTVVTFRDVTEQRWLNEAIRLREAQYRDALTKLDLLFTNSPDAMLTARRAPDGRFVYETVNPMWLRMSDTVAADVIDHGPEECLPPGPARIILAAWDECLRQCQPVTYFARSEPHGGHEWESTVVPVADGDGTINRLIGIARDVTKRNKLEASVRQMQRMEAVGQLTAGVAHDFNNLLQAIAGALEMLRQSAELPPDALECAGVAEAAAQRGATLVHRLLAFSRQQSLDPTILSVRDVYDDLSVLLSGTLGGRIRVETTTENGIWPIRADAGQLENCLFNLALNARDAMPGGGTLSLRADNVRAEAALAEGLPPGDYVRLTVEDNGTGMEPETLMRALEPFFTTKPIGKGTGLGLAMVQGFTRQSGGDIRIASAPGRGTSVSLWLPRAIPVEPPQAACQPVARSAQPPGQGHVLVVDDEPSICRMLTMSLTKAGFQAVARQSGDLALEYLREGGACDLLISDQSMPELTGSELIEQATRLRPDLQTMLITGHDLASELDRLGGQVTVLRKPFRQAALLGQIKALLSPKTEDPRAATDAVAMN